MKCANCGAELKLGCVYCSVCGKEAQIVPDYNILEDDILKSLLTEEEQKAQVDAERISREKKQSEASEKKGTGKKKKKKKSMAPLIIVICVIVIIVSAGIAMLVIRNNRVNSFGYQYSQGIRSEQEQNYPDAIAYYKRALEIEEDHMDVMLDLAKAYGKANDETSKEAWLLTLIREDKAKREAYEDVYEDAYKELIALYDKQEKYDLILDLYEEVEDSNIKNLFSSYVVVAPEFTPPEGDYDDNLEVTLDAMSDYTIYYTTDGTDPTQYGDIYSETIALDVEGTTTIKAVAKDERGIYSDIITAVYTVKYEIPEEPVANPDTGSFSMPTNVTIEVPEGCSAYYTWDGTTPTTASPLYTEPLAIPEGNNVLAVIIVDQHNLSSVVGRFNYIYQP